MKKNTLYLIAAVILIIAAVMVVLIKKDVFKSADDLGPVSHAMAIKDTSKVEKIFIADMRGNKVLLSKTPKGWMVDDSIPALLPNVKDLLSILKNITVIQTVPKKTQNTINRSIALRGIKVDIYEVAPKFTFLGIQFGVKERITKTYYLGEATQTNIGSYAVLEGLSEPYIVGVPGFRGFITPLFSPMSINWYSHVIFQTKITRIQKVIFTDLEQPQESFSVEKAGPRFFTLYAADNQMINHYDTTKIINMLSEFREKNYTSMAVELTKGQIDTIFQYHFKDISLTDVNGKTTVLHLYRLMEHKEIMENGELTGKIDFVANRDRFYGTINDDKSTIYRLQYFNYDRVIQPLSYFLKK